MALQEYLVSWFGQFLEFVELKHLVSNLPNIKSLKRRFHLILRKILRSAALSLLFVSFSHLLSEVFVNLVADARKNLLYYLKVNLHVYLSRNFKLKIRLLCFLKVVGK